MLLLPLLAVLGACDEDTFEPEVDAPADELAVTDPDAALVAAIEEITDQIGIQEASSLAGASEGNEAPAFGSQLFADAFAGSDAPELTASVETDTAIAVLPTDQVKIYNVLALWGRIRPNDRTEWSPLQWDPALQVAEGDALRVRRTLLFESGDEVHPQEERNLVTMTSWTGPHVDGVTAQVAIVGPTLTPTDAADVTSSADEQFLAFRSHTFLHPYPRL